MKKIYFVKTALVLFLSTALLSSCLKDSTRGYVFTNDQPVADFALTAVAAKVLQPAALVAATPTTNIVNALVTIGAPKDMSTAIPVTVVIGNQAYLDATYGVGKYILLPASVYTSTSLTVNVIPGIQQRIENQQPVVGTPLALPSVSLGMVSFTINTTAYQTLTTANPGVIYVLPLSITSAPGAVLDQFEHLDFQFSIK